MAYQSPLISIPKKTTSDVDWTNPIRSVIAQSYGEDPNSYAEECSVLQRIRQDAVKGAGSDQTARDLLYKYFGQLELLELRFAEIKVSFPWNDAFTLKLTTQTSLAFEKASIIHLLASVLSSLAASGSRADPEGVKRAYYNARAAAGMLTYINENFLHAPSTDLSREVVHLLIGLMMAQATEVFTEKLVEEKKSPALVCRSANQAAGMYSGLVDEMKEFQGKGVFDRNWLHILQIKAKLFGSLAQYYRSVADSGSGKHGAGLVRMRLADTLAQDAQRQASNFAYSFVPSSTPTLPHDASTSLQEITKAHATICAEAKEQAVKDNDLIYHDILPSEASLPQIEKLPSATPITIQEVYNNPDVSKLIGGDIFIRLVPLAVHESASVYSEEKAKLVRGEVERVEISEGELRAGLEHLGLPGIVSAWKRIAEEEDDDGQGDVEVSADLRRLARVVQGAGLENMLRDIESERERCERELRELSSMLDNESREVERMRAKYAPQFTQPPSGPQTAHFRSNISSNLGSLSAAASSDSHIVELWRSIQPDIAVLAAGEGALQAAARQVAAGKAPSQPPPGVSLLDLEEDVGSKTGLAENEKEELRKAIGDASERLDRVGKIRRERDEVLKDLKEKVQNDDVSSLLLLNRRSGNVEPQLFASELEKFRPYQGRLAAAVQASQSIVQELEMLVRQVEKGKGVKERQRGQRDRQKRVREWERKLEQAGEQFGEVQAGLSKGLSFYESLKNVTNDLGREVRAFVKNREQERNKMVADIETRQRLAGSPPPPPAAPSASRGIEAHLAGLSIGPNGYGNRSPYPTSPPPQQSISSYSSTPGLPAPPPQISTPSYLPPPPSQPAKPSSPYDFSNLGNLHSAFSTAQSPSSQYPSHPPPRPEPPAPPRQSSYSYPSTTSSNPYPPPPQSSSNPYSPQQSSNNPYPPPQSSSNPYPPPPSRPSQTQAYNGYQAPSQTYSTPPQPQSSSPYFPAPPQHQPYHSSSPPPPSQYPSYAPPPSQPPQQAQYNSQPPPQQQPYGAYQPPQQPGYPGYQPQSGYPYR
ncbi:BRO1-like domain-domain-containing protein [Naematelia encephala]|uniref:BRO domain-containing protein 1 n=1 Tax=Naematelia encephala TaxID=71784 RepID=A0A1Y2BM23_9TREE|nr:BRO1-like domain-domain-containing protein [Naematelia encephala]